MLFTHPHADHTHGIDDLRALFVKARRRLDAYLDEPTSRALMARFGYCFEKPPGSDYPPILTEHRIEGGRRLTITGEGGPLEVLPILQQHGNIPSLGFRFGSLAYSCDLSGLPPESVAALAGLDVWIVDALRYAPHPSHFSAGRRPGLDRAREAQAGHPDQPALRPRLRGAAAATAAERGAGF